MVQAGCARAQQVLPLKEACGDFLFEQLAEKDAAGLLALSDKYGMRRMRRALIAHLARNFEALYERVLLNLLAVDVWQEVLRQDALAVRAQLRSGECGKVSWHGYHARAA